MKYSKYIISGILIVLIIGAGFLGYKYSKAFYISQKNLAASVTSLQESLANTKNDLQALRTELQGSVLKAENENKKLTTTLAQEQAIRAKSDLKPSSTSVVSEWRPRITFVSCYWSSGEVRLGSALLLGRIDGTFQFQTNKHVVYDDNEGTSPTRCTVKLPNDTSVAVSHLDLFENDSAHMLVDNPTTQMTKYASSIISKACNSQQQIGDALVVLGYPTIGSASDITATEGIVSGYEDNYYITSAKIEQGNSGGAAISIKNDCYMGIPTLTVLGKIESLGRILDWKVLHL